MGGGYHTTLFLDVGKRGIYIPSIYKIMFYRINYWMKMRRVLSREAHTPAKRAYTHNKQRLFVMWRALYYIGGESVTFK